MMTKKQFFHRDAFNIPDEEYAKLKTGHLMAAIMMLLIPLVASISLAREGARIRDSHSWAETPCMISDSGYVSKWLRSGGDSRHYYFPHVTYSYEFDGIGYESQRLRIAETKYRFLTEVHKFEDSYPKGQLATCYVNPHCPAESTLELSSRWSAWAFLFPLSVGIAFCNLFGWIGLKYLRLRNTSGNAVAEITEPVAV